MHHNDDLINTDLFNQNNDEMLGVLCYHSLWPYHNQVSVKEKKYFAIFSTTDLHKRLSASFVNNK